MSDRVTHLQMIQSVISRMAGNSFLVKGWSLTLIVAILVLGAEDGAWPVVCVALVPAVVFWYLDAFFLRQERLFRALYDAVRRQDPDAEVDFSMNTAVHADAVASTWGVAFSRTLLVFHGAMLAIVVIFVVLVAAAAAS